MNILRDSQEGMALVLVLVFTLLLLAAGAALLDMALKDQQVTGYHSADIKQYYLAEAGIESYLFLLNSSSFTGEDLNYTHGDGSFTVSLHDHDQEISLIYSTGSTDRGSTTLAVSIEQSDDGSYSIAEWIKP